MPACLSLKVGTTVIMHTSLQLWSRGVRVPLFSWFPRFWKSSFAKFQLFSFIFSPFSPNFTLFFLVFHLCPLTTLMKTYERRDVIWCHIHSQSGIKFIAVVRLSLRESNFLASVHLITALCMCVCCIFCTCGLCLTTGIQCSNTRRRQWPGSMKPKSYSLVEGNWTIWIKVVMLIFMSPNGFFWSVSLSCCFSSSFWWKFPGYHTHKPQPNLGFFWLKKPPSCFPLTTSEVLLC